MQQRIRNLLLMVGYQANDFIFADSIYSATNIIHQCSISFALVDLGLPDGNGTEFIEVLRQQNSIVPILVISAWSMQEAILNALQAGATGYVLKERDDFEVVIAIRNILRGGAPIDPFMAQQILCKFLKPVSNQEPNTDNQQDNYLLSKREHEILTFVATGMSNQEIAESIHLSKYTVECHIKNIYRKLSVSTRTKAIAVARDIGLLE